MRILGIEERGWDKWGKWVSVIKFVFEVFKNFLGKK